jgi:hypothetical protein
MMEAANFSKTSTWWEEYMINSDMSIDPQKHSGLKAFLHLISEDYI